MTQENNIRYNFSNNHRIKRICNINGNKFNFDDYIVNKDGTIYSKYNKIYLKPHLRRDGYYTVKINRKDYAIHRLVAQKYIPNPKNYPYINHINHIKTDNRVENLEWCTPRQNSIHGIGKKVYQYDLKGNLVNTYNAITEIDANKFNRKIISNRCRKNNCIHRWYIFSYCELDEEHIHNITRRSKWYCK